MAHYFRLVQSSTVVLFVVTAVVMVYTHQATSCKESEFTCSSSKCISNHLTCDGENDCGDFSDEMNCTRRGKCNVNEFECSEGSCISSTLVCNGKLECPRGLDETNCESKTTAPTTPSFEQLGIFYTVEGKVKSFPVFDKSLGISLYLRFTAHRCAGNLFEMTSQNTDQFFLLSLTGNGNIEFLFQTSSGPGMVVIPPPPGDSFCNGKRHMLSLRRYLDELRYRVNRGRSVSKKIGVLKEPFSRPFRVYVGTTLEGCVSGIDVIFYRTQSKTYSVGFSKGCTKVQKKTTLSPSVTTASTLGLITTSMHTRIGKKSLIHSSSTSDFSKKVPFTEINPNGKVMHGVTSVMQDEQVIHSQPVTLPTVSYTSQGASAQSSKVTLSRSTRAQTPSVTQSDNIMDPYFIGEGGIKLSLDTNNVTSPTTPFISGSKGSTDYVTHFSPTVESIGRSSTKDTTTSTSSKSFVQTTINVLPKHKRCEPLRSKFCTFMGYNQTRLPTRAGQLRAGKQMSRFLPFIRANCSRVLRDFICVTHLPPCSSQHSPTVPPCRELCLRSKRECAPLMKAFDFDWPEHLDCQNFPLSSEDGKCVMAHDNGAPVVPTQATDHNRNSGCGGILSRSSGVITTPFFPNPYPPNTLCKWVIILPKIYHVVDIILEEVSLEADVNCGYDYLLFLDGLSNQVGPRISGFLAYPRVITIKGNIASIVFKSDSVLSKKGALIKYQAHCPFLSCSGDDVRRVDHAILYKSRNQVTHRQLTDQAYLYYA